MTAAHSRLDPLGVDHRPEYVLGYPIHVALTVRNLAPGSILALLPHASVFDPGSGIRVVVQDAESGTGRADPGPPYDVESEEGEGCFELRFGESRRMLTDIAALMPTALTPGRYLFTLQYGAPHAYASERTGPVAIRRPDPDEAAELDRLRPEIEHNGWGSWTLYRRPDPALANLPAAQGPAHFNHVLRALIFDADMDPAILDTLDELYRPEAAVLAVELARFNGDSRWRVMVEAAREAHPELAWYIRLVERDQGLIAFYRSMHTRNT